MYRPFKTHYLIDRAKGAYAPTKSRAYKIRRGFRQCSVTEGSLGPALDARRSFYDHLVDRHGITGVTAFPESYFIALAADPRFRLFVAQSGDEAVAMTLWFEHEGVAVHHLTAASPRGYATEATSCLYDAAIETFGAAAVIDLGSSAGPGDDHEDGLARFKRTFSNAPATAMLCGAVLDHPRYLAMAAGRTDDDYFPGYRA